MTVQSAQRRATLTALAQGYERDLPLARTYLLDRGISVEAARMFHLGVATTGDYAGRLAIPYYTPAGVVALKYRCMGHHDCKTADCTKYLYMPGTGLHLFNAQVLINASDLVVITEGELDAVCVQAYCGIPAVAYPGADTWSKQPHYRLCFEGVSEVVVVADGEKVGRDAARRVADSIGISARVVHMPDGEDSNSYLAQQGAGSFIERLAL